MTEGSDEDLLAQPSARIQLLLSAFYLRRIAKVTPASRSRGGSTSQRMLPSCVANVLLKVLDSADRFDRQGQCHSLGCMDCEASVEASHVPSAGARAPRRAASCKAHALLERGSLTPGRGRVSKRAARPPPFTCTAMQRLAHQDSRSARAGGG